MRDLRVWANYQNIDDLLRLYGTGYKTFLDQNLATLVFFIGAIAELSFIAVFSAESYVAELQSFYDLFASNNETLRRDFRWAAIMQRLVIYQRLGIVTSGVTLQAESEPNAVDVTV